MTYGKATFNTHPFMFRFFSSVPAQHRLLAIESAPQVVHPTPQSCLQAAAFTETLFHKPLYTSIQMYLGAGEHNKTYESSNHGLKYKIGPLVQGNVTWAIMLIYLIYSASSQ